MDEKLYQFRKPIRLKDYDYSWAGYYFVTVVSYQRKNIFGEIDNDIVQLTRVGEIVENCWKETPQHYPYVEVDAYIVMPNHFHGILIINDVGVQHRRFKMSNHNHYVGARLVFVFSTLCASPLQVIMELKSQEIDTLPLPQKINSQPKRKPLGIVIGSFKSAVTKRIHDLGLLDQEKICKGIIMSTLFVMKEITRKFTNISSQIQSIGLSMKKISNVKMENRVRYAEPLQE